MAKDLVLSYNRINIYCKCPRLYKEYYINKIKMPTNDLMDIGKIIHQVAEEYYRGEKNKKKILDKLWKEYNINDLQYYKNCIEMINNIPKYNNIEEIEYEFTLPLNDDFNITGRIDLIAKDIIDFKTSRMVYYDDLQAVIYKWACDLMGWDNKFYFYFLSKDEKILIDKTPKEIKDTMSFVDIIGNKILAEKFEPTLNKFCYNCQFREDCNEYKNITQNNNQEGMVREYLYNKNKIKELSDKNEEIKDIIETIYENIPTINIGNYIVLFKQQKRRDKKGREYFTKPYMEVQNG